MTTCSASFIDTKRAWQALAILLIGMFMALLDTTIVNIALPSIKTSLNTSDAALSWIISGYALAYGLALIPAGRLGDRFGHKWVFCGGLALFTVASFACGIAQSSAQLIVARVIQGLAGGIFFPAVIAFIQLLFVGYQRGKAFAIMGAVIGVSTALGPIVGGILIQAFGETAGWRLVFWVNLPLGAAALLGAVMLLPAKAERSQVSGKVDWLGLLLITVSLVAMLVPLIEGQDSPWPVWSYLSLFSGVILLVIFALWEVRVARQNGDPLIPPHLFKHRSFTGGTILALVYFAAFTSIFFTLSIFWQSGLGHGALAAGLISLPFAIGDILGASYSHKLAARWGRTSLSMGTGLLAIGLALLWLLLTTIPATELTIWTIAAPLFVAGMGCGLFIAANSQFIVATVERNEAGAAAAVIGTVQRLGSATGIAVVGSVFFGSLSIAPLSAEQIGEIGQRYAGQGADAIQTAIAAYTQENVALGFGNSAAMAISVAAMLAFIAFFLVFTLPKKVASGAST
jgi:EmrB/QacA subfamily drug resistance transporter